MVRNYNYSDFGRSSLCLGERPLPTAAPQKLVSANVFADNANQNSGNMLTGRSTTRVAQPPGGASSICLGMDPPPRPGAGDLPTRPSTTGGCRSATTPAEDYGRGSRGSRQDAARSAPGDVGQEYYREAAAPEVRPRSSSGGYAQADTRAFNSRGGNWSAEVNDRAGYAGYADSSRMAAPPVPEDDYRRAAPPTAEESGGRPLRTSMEESLFRDTAGSAAGQSLSRSRFGNGMAENDASFSNRRLQDGGGGSGNCPAKLNQRHAELCAAGRRRRAFPDQGASQIVFG